MCWIQCITIVVHTLLVSLKSLEFTTQFVLQAVDDSLQLGCLKELTSDVN